MRPQPMAVSRPLLLAAACGMYFAVTGFVLYTQRWLHFRPESGTTVPSTYPTSGAIQLEMPEKPVPRDTMAEPVTNKKPDPSTFWKNEEMAEYIRKNHGVTQHYPNESIFISIASYGDLECGPSLARAFARAVHPDRIFVGLYQQHNCTGETDNEEPCRECAGDFARHVKCPEHPVCGRQWQIRASRLHMKETQGVTYGRYMAEAHFKNETYIMNIDAHSYFMHGWDSMVIDMFKRANDEYAVLTTYPVSYDYAYSGWTDESNGTLVIKQPDHPAVICQTTRMDVYGGMTHTWRHAAHGIPNPGKPVRSAFLAGGLNFARGHRHHRVPYDPYTPFLFDGEELSFGARLWSHGYDLYHPDIQVIAHLYAKPGLRPGMWDVNWKERERIQKRSNLRVNYIIGLHDEWDSKVPVESLDLREIERFGAGKVRPIREFFNWAKLYLKKHEPAHSQQLCKEYSSGGMPQYPRPTVGQDAWESCCG